MTLDKSCLWTSIGLLISKTGIVIVPTLQTYGQEKGDSAREILTVSMTLSETVIITWGAVGKYVSVGLGSFWNSLNDYVCSVYLVGFSS